MKKELGYVGLGKMGLHMALGLKEKGWNVVGYDIAEETRKTAKQKGLRVSSSLRDLVSGLSSPRIVWLMVPAGSPVDQALQELMPLLSRGDIIVDGGNSLFEDSQRRAVLLQKKGIALLDAGVSGGPETVRSGRPAVMVGGKKAVFEKVRPLFEAITGKENLGYMGDSGAGHFVKMVHNGIEYGMMQALAEGMAVLKASPYKIKLKEAVRVYNNGSIIQSRLTQWLLEGLKKYGEDLKEASGSVSHTGEGEWTVETAKKLKVQVPVIEAAFRFRIQSGKNPSFAGKVLMTLRAVFGGHALKRKK